MSAIDRLPESNLDRVAFFTAGLGLRIREEDPRAMFDELVGLCSGHPAKAAQIIMVFAAWFDPSEPTEYLVKRAAEIPRPFAGIGAGRE